MKQLFTTIIVITLALNSRAADSKVPVGANDYFQIGFEAANQGNPALAVKNYNLAIGLDPSRICFYYHRGLANRALGNKAAAIADFNSCNNLRPIAEAYYQIGLFKYEESNLLGAKQEFEKARELKEDVEKVNFYLGVINYRIGDFPTAVKNLERFTTLVKTNSDAFLFLALANVKLKHFDEARGFLKSASLYTTNDWKLYLKMYEIYREIGDLDNQLYNLSMVIELGQHKAEYYLMRAKIYQQLGDKERANEDLYFSQNIAEAK
ncbi:MAG: hypothetical protein U0T73_00220 [Chitinophagales bacterium]